MNLPVELVAGLRPGAWYPNDHRGQVQTSSGSVALGGSGVARAGDSPGRELGLVERPRVGSFVAAAVLAPIASTIHASPGAGDRPRGFRSPAVVLSSAARSLYSIGFFGMLLAKSVPHVGGELIDLEAGLAITTGRYWSPRERPERAAAERLATGRCRRRRPDVRGRTAVLRTIVEVESKYFTHWLPGALLIGVGVALSFPVLSAAAVAGLPQERFGIGGAINQTARQIGAVLGVAVLIAILGTPSSLDQALHRFRVAWLIGMLAAISSAAISSFHRRPVEVAAAAVRVAPVPLDAR